MLFAKIDPYAKMINEGAYLCPDLEWRIDLINIQLTPSLLYSIRKRALMFGANTKRAQAGRREERREFMNRWRTH